jgi:hypothetical protein
MRAVASDGLDLPFRLLATSKSKLAVDAPRASSISLNWPLGANLRSFMREILNEA